MCGSDIRPTPPLVERLRDAGNRTVNHNFSRWVAELLFEAADALDVRQPSPALGVGGIGTVAAVDPHASSTGNPLPREAIPDRVSAEGKPTDATEVQPEPEQ